MLPPFDRERYQTFLEALKQLQEQLNERYDSVQLQSTFSQLQQQFQEEIMSLTGENLSDQVFSSWQSSQTEIHRMMRLLQNDLIFLQTSRNPDTFQQRLTTVKARVGKLIDFATELTKEYN